MLTVDQGKVTQVFTVVLKKIENNQSRLPTMKKSAFFLVLENDPALGSSRIKQPHELWELEHHLTVLRKAIDSKYVYKYSTLVLFFADLVCEGKLDLKDLRGLSEEKLLYIRHYAEQSAA